MARPSRSTASKTTTSAPASSGKKAKTATTKPASKTAVAAAAKASSAAKGKAKPKSKETVSSDDEEEGEDKAGSSEDEPMTFKEFKAEVKDLKTVIGEAKGKDGLIDFVLQPKEFSTGSFGWNGIKNTKFPVGTNVRDVTVTVNIVVNHSKPDQPKPAASKAKTTAKTKAVAAPTSKGKKVPTKSTAASSKRKAKESSKSGDEDDAEDADGADGADSD